MVIVYHKSFWLDRNRFQFILIETIWKWKRNTSDQLESSWKPILGQLVFCFSFFLPFSTSICLNNKFNVEKVLEINQTDSFDCILSGKDGEKVACLLIGKCARACCLRFYSFRAQWAFNWSASNRMDAIFIRFLSAMQFHFVFTIAYKYYVKAAPNMDMCSLLIIYNSSYCFLNRCISKICLLLYYGCWWRSKWW